MSILDLPPELQELIAECLYPVDLNSFRQTCHALLSISQTTFRTKQFRNSAFLMEMPDSIQALLRISTHLEYGRTVKQINLSPGRLETCPVSGHTISPHRMHDCPETEKHIRWPSDAIEREHKDFWSGRDVSCLTQILRNFMAMKNIPILKTVHWAFSPDDTQPSRRTPFAYPYIKELCEQSNCGLTVLHEEQERPHVNLWKAIIRTGFLVEFLELGLPNSGFPVHMFRFVPPNSHFEHLRQLFLSFCMQKYSTRLSAGFVNFLRHARSVEYLSLKPEVWTTGRFWMSNTFKAVAMAANEEPLLPHLWGLELVNVYTELDDLCHFVRCHKGSLRHLRLLGVREADFTPREDAEDLLRVASGKDDLTLQMFRAYDAEQRSIRYWTTRTARGLPSNPEKLEESLDASAFAAFIEEQEEIIRRYG